MNRTPGVLRSQAWTLGGRQLISIVTPVMALLFVFCGVSLASPIELSQAVSQGDVSYTIRGMDNSGRVHFEIRNHREYIVTVEIEEGTELVPAEGDVQRMAVTKEYTITVHGHAHEEPEVVEVRDIDVACLDISREAPSTANRSWTLRRPAALRSFLSCLDSHLQDAADDSSDAEARPMLVQLGLWEARGATRAQWVDFFVTYWELPRDKAGQLIDGLKPLLDPVVQECGSLTSI